MMSSGFMLPARLWRGAFANAMSYAMTVKPYAQEEEVVTLSADLRCPQEYVFCD